MYTSTQPVDLNQATFSDRPTLTNFWGAPSVPQAGISQAQLAPLVITPALLLPSSLVPQLDPLTWLSQRRAALADAQSNYDINNLLKNDTGAEPFEQDGTTAYNAPGAGPATVLTWTVPAGFVALIRQMSIVHVGGGFQDGSGNIIWRVFKNGAPYRGLNNLLAQYGALQTPRDLYPSLLAMENDVLTITATVPAAAPAPPGPGMNSTALQAGSLYPIALLGGKQ